MTKTTAAHLSAYQDILVDIQSVEPNVHWEYHSLSDSITHIFNTIMSMVKKTTQKY